MTRMSCDLLEQRQTIPDPRRLTRNRKHLLRAVLLRGFCGVLADGNNFVEIADGARHQEDFWMWCFGRMAGVCMTARQPRMSAC